MSIHPDIPAFRRGSQSSSRSTSSRCSSTASLPPPTWRQSLISTSTPTSPARGKSSIAIVSSPLANPILSTSTTEAEQTPSPLAPPMGPQKLQAKDRLKNLLPDLDSYPGRKRQRVVSQISITSSKDREGVFTMYSEEEVVTSSEETSIAGGSSEAGQMDEAMSVGAATTMRTAFEHIPMDIDPNPPSSSSSSSIVPFPTSSPMPTPTKTKTSWFSSLSRSSTLGRANSKGNGKERMRVADISFTPPPSALVNVATAEPQQDTTNIHSTPKPSIETSQVTLQPSVDTTSTESIPTPPPPLLASPSSSSTITPIDVSTPTPTSTPTAAQPIPGSSTSSMRKKTGWFGYSSPKSPSFAPERTHLTQPSKRASLASSLDDSVPPSPNTPTSPQLERPGQMRIYSSIRPDLKIYDAEVDAEEGESCKGTVEETVRGKNSLDGTERRERTLSSLNPSTSRFSLGVVLLGRGMGSKSGEGNNEKTVERRPESSDDVNIDLGSNVSGLQPKDSAMDPADPPPSSSAVECPPTPSTSDDVPDLLTPTSPTATDTQTTDNEAPHEGVGWWSYLGWSAGTAPPGISSAIGEGKLENGDIPSPDQNGNVVQPPSLSTEVTSTVAVSDPVAKPDGEAGGQEEEEGSVPQSGGDNMDTKSQNAVAAGAAWYVPWGWYGGSGSTPTPSIRGVDAEEGKKEDEHVIDVASVEDVNGITPAEQVKADAEAQSSSSSQPPTPSSSTPLPSPSPSTMNPSSSTWTSFWSSKVVTSSITAKIDSGKLITEHGEGMEVMDVPDEIDEGEDSTIPTTKKEDAGPRESDKMRRVRQAPPLTVSEEIKKDVVSLPNASRSRERNRKISTPRTPVTRPASSTSNEKGSRGTSPAPSKKSISSAPSTSPASTSKLTTIATPKSPPPPNLVLPSFKEMFHTPPRSIVPTVPDGGGGRFVERLGGFVRGVLFNTPESPSSPSFSQDHHQHWPHIGGVEDEKRWKRFGMELARAWDVVESGGTVVQEKRINGPVGVDRKDPLRGAKRAVVIGVHGWFPGGMMRSVIGEPTGTSSKFATMMAAALEDFEEKHDVKFEKITQLPLEGEGTIEKRVDKLYTNLTSNEDWMSDLYDADVIFVATHSQGSIVATHILDRLFRDSHIITRKGPQPPSPSRPLSATFTSSEEVNILPSSPTPPSVPKKRKVQRVCCLALCGIHLGPLRYLASSSAFQGYIQYFESVAARQLFEFQNSDNKVSQEYTKALANVLDHETKMVYIASLNDQVVPIYSGLFTTAQHPLILRALYIDGDAYKNYDYISNLLVLLIKVLNSGISDSGLLAHLSEATAGSLNGVGHSTAYEEIANFQVAVDYMFLTNEGEGEHETKLNIEPFNAALEQNDYEIPWSLRDLIADERVAHFFANDILDLREQFRDWHPKTTILRDMKRKLGPIQRLPPGFRRGGAPSGPTTHHQHKL